LGIVEGIGFTAETQSEVRDAKFFEVKRNAEGSEVAEGDAEEEKRIGDWRLEIAEGFGFTAKTQRSLRNAEVEKRIGDWG
jgi:hypothetical protein